MCSTYNGNNNSSIHNSAFAAENNSISVSSFSESNTSIDDIAKHIQELRTEVYKVNTQIRSISKIGRAHV